MLNYTYTLHEDISDDHDPPKEYYRTSNNKYLITAVGIRLNTKKERYEHHLAIGYTFILNQFILEALPTNTTNKTYGPAYSSMRSGFMLCYTIYLRDN